MAKSKANTKRAKGEGAIIKRGQIYALRITINGKVILRSLKTGNRQEAEVRAKELKKELGAVSSEVSAIGAIAKAHGVSKRVIDEATEHILHMPENKIALIDAMESYEALPKVTAVESTLIEYRRFWKKFVDHTKRSKRPASQRKYLHQIDRNMGKSFAKWLDKQGLSINSYNKTINFCIALFDALAEDAEILTNPFLRSKDIKKKGEVQEKREFSQEQLNAIAEELEAGGYPREIRTAFILARYTGLRRKDVILLRWESIDMDREFPVIITKPRKTARQNKYVHVPILGPLIYELKERLREGPNEGYVMPELANLYGKDPSAVGKRLSKVFVGAGIDDSALTFHSFRYSYVSECAKAGVPMAIVQGLVGHGSPSMTRHYTKIDSDTTSKTMKTLEASWSDEKSFQTIEYSKPTPLNQIEDLLEKQTIGNWQSIKQEVLSLIKDLKKA